MKRLMILAVVAGVALPTAKARAEYNFAKPCGRPAVGWLAAAPCMSRLIRETAAVDQNSNILPIAAAIDANAEQVRAGRITEEQAKANTDAVIAERNVEARAIQAEDLKQRRAALARQYTREFQQMWNSHIRW